MKDALGYEIEVGDTVAHVPGTRGRVTERTILAIDDAVDRWDGDIEVATISPEDCSWRSGRPGKNVRGHNLVLIRKAGR